MEKTKRALALLLAGAAALTLAGCKRITPAASENAAAKAETAAETTAPEYIYKADFTTVYSGGADSGFAPLVMTDEGLYCATLEKVGENIPEGVTPEYEGQYDIKEACLALIGFDGKVTALENYVPLKTDIDSEGKRDFAASAHPESMTVGEDGSLIVLEQVITSYSEAPEDIKPDDPEYFNYYNSTTQSFVRVLDTTGAEISCAEINLPADSYVTGLYVDADGSVAVGCDDAIYFLGTDGALRYTVEADDYIDSVTRLRDGRIGALGYGAAGMEVRVADRAAKAFAEKTYPITGSTYTLIPGAGDYDFYYTSGSGFYGYTLESEEAELLFSWLDSDVNGDALTSVRVCTDGVLRAFNAEYSSRGDKYTLDLVTLTKVPYDSVPQKEHLTFATVGTDYDTLNAVIKFNRASDKYHIDIKDYYELTGSSSYTDAQTKLFTEIMAGTLPDIIDLSDMPYQQLAAKGLLEDIYPYIDADPALDRSDFFHNVLEAYEVDGRLCAIVPGFGVMSLMGASSVVGDTPGWTYDDYYAALATMPEGCQGLDSQFTKETMLQVGLAIDMNTYMDWSTGRCSFDSDAFKQLLAFADQFKSDAEMASYEYTDEDSAAYRISQGQQMLTEVLLFNFNESSGDNPFNTDVTYIGFPNVTGEPGNVLRGINELGITSACRDKAAAWEFARTFLTEDYQTELSIFPTNMNAFNTLLDEAQVIEYERDANGNILLDENGEKKRLIIGVMYDGINYTNMYSGISPERAETIKTLAQSTSKLLNYDQSILDIVTSEAQAYFAGQKSADEVARLVQSKANIYVNEQR